MPSTPTLPKASNAGTNHADKNALRAKASPTKALYQKMMGVAFANVPLLAMGLAACLLAGCFLAAPRMSGAVPPDPAAKVATAAEAGACGDAGDVAVRAAVKPARGESNASDASVTGPLLPRSVVNRERDARGAEIEARLNGPDASWEEERRERVQRLSDSAGDTAHDESPLGWQSLEEFLDAVPAWKGPDAYVFHVAKKVPLPRRAQRSGLCYMHAPFVVQRYLVSPAQQQQQQQQQQQRDIGMSNGTSRE